MNSVFFFFFAFTLAHGIHWVDLAISTLAYNSVQQGKSSHHVWWGKIQLLWMSAKIHSQFLHFYFHRVAKSEDTIFGALFYVIEEIKADQ